jgi:uncharacterized integral membrane protein (TIGR00697 family)
MSLYKLIKINKNTSSVSIATIKLIDAPRGFFNIPIEKIIKDKKMLSRFEINDIVSLVGMATTENVVTVKEYESIQQPKYLNLFLMLFVTAMIASNIGSSKIASIFGFTITGGIFSFCSSYIIADIINEVYGFQRVRQIIWFGLICNIVMLILLQISISLPSSPFWHNQLYFKGILGTIPRVLIASLMSYTISEFTNSYIMSKLKVKKMHFLLRTFISTFFGIVVDTLLFTIIAFWGKIPNIEIFYLAVKIYLCKIIFENVFVIIAWKIIDFIKFKENLDILDYDTNFTPFSIDINYNKSHNIYNNTKH